MLSQSAANRLRMLLVVVAGTVVVSLAVLAVFLVIGAMSADAAGDGADWGAVY